MSNNSNEKVLQIAICGAPNVGKSSLLNHILGCKISIVSSKPQTTRENINGIHTKNDTQLVFVDTPGLLVTKKNVIDKRVFRNAWTAIKTCDIVCLMVDPKKYNDLINNVILSQANELGIETVVVISKSDLTTFADRVRIAEEIKSKYPHVRDVLSLSTHLNRGCDNFIEYFTNLAKPSSFLFSANIKTDASIKTVTADLVREKIFNYMSDEVPYVSHCETEIFRKNSDHIEISVIVLIVRDSIKQILIGKSGANLKKIIWEASLELEKLLGRKVKLKIFIKIDPTWQDKYANTESQLSDIPEYLEEN